MEDFLLTHFLNWVSLAFQGFTRTMDISWFLAMGDSTKCEQRCENLATFITIMDIYFLCFITTLLFSCLTCAFSADM